MEEHQRTQFAQGGLVVDGDVTPLYAGELHYFQCEPSTWANALEQMATVGFTAVSTVVPWSLHEERAGRYRWSGTRDLARFIEIAADAKLQVIAKPGPLCGAELTFYGLPERVLRQGENLAVTGRGTPAWMPAPPRMFPLPSQASSSYRKEVARWLTEVGRVLEPFAQAGGPLVALGLDNHLGGFYRTGAYDVDYHPDSLEWWAEHSGDLEPPRTWDEDDAVRCARWVEFKEVYVARAMTWLGRTLDDAGLAGVAKFHNAPPVAPGNVSALRVSGRTKSLAAWDVYQLSAGYDHMRELGRYLAGSTRVPFASALGCGAPAYLPPASPSIQRSAAIATLGAGVRALSISMVGARDRWSGAASELSAEDDWVQPLITALRKLNWSTLHVDAPVAVIETRADSRYGVASSFLGPVTTQLAGLVDLGSGGFAEFGRDEGARTTARWQRAVRKALDDFEIPFVIVDEAAPLDSLDRYRLIICPTHDRVDAGLWAKLSVVASKTTRVIIGPTMPSIDAFGETLADAELVPGMGLLRSTSLADGTLGSDLSGAVGELGDDWIAPGATNVSCTVHRNNAGEAKALALVNTGDALQAQLAVPAGVSLRDALDQQTWTATADGVVGIELAARSARLLAIDV